MNLDSTWLVVWMFFFCTQRRSHPSGDRPKKNPPTFFLLCVCACVCVSVCVLFCHSFSVTKEAGVPGKQHPQRGTQSGETKQNKNESAFNDRNTKGNRRRGLKQKKTKRKMEGKARGNSRRESLRYSLTEVGVWRNRGRKRPSNSATSGGCRTALQKRARKKNETTKRSKKKSPAKRKPADASRRR